MHDCANVTRHVTCYESAVAPHRGLSHHGMRRERAAARAGPPRSAATSCMRYVYTHLPHAALQTRTGPRAIATRTSRDHTLNHYEANEDASHRGGRASARAAATPCHAYAPPMTPACLPGRSPCPRSGRGLTSSDLPAARAACTAGRARHSVHENASRVARAPPSNPTVGKTEGEGGKQEWGRGGECP